MGRPLLLIAFCFCHPIQLFVRLFVVNERPPVDITLVAACAFLRLHQRNSETHTTLRYISITTRMAFDDPVLEFDDQSFALQLQLDEIEAQRELRSGKWTEDNPPDYVVAFDDFEAELKKVIALVEDHKLAHSIAKAVDTDSVAIEESRIEETQSIQDRAFALGLNAGENLPAPSQDATESTSQFGADSAEWNHVLRATEASTFS